MAVFCRAVSCLEPISEFLEKIGRSLESANLREARFIGDIARNLEMAMFSGTYEDIEMILDHTKRRISKKIRVTD